MPMVVAPREPSVGLAPLPSERASPSANIEAFGGGAADRQIDLTGVQNEAERVYQEEKNKADQTAVVDAASQASELETKLSVQTKQRLGKDAFGAPDDVQKAWTDGTSGIEKGLQNSAQRQSWQNIKASHWRELNATVQTHVAEQRKVYDAQTTDSYVANERNAALSSGDPNRVSLAQENIVSAISDHLDRLYNGSQNVPDGMRKEAMDAAVSGLHLAYLQQLVDKHQGLAAKAYLEAHKDEIEGGQLGQAEKMVQEGSILGQAQQVRDQVLAKGMTETDAIAEVRKIKDPEVQARAEELIRTEFSEQRQAGIRARQDLYRQATDAVAAHGHLEDIPPSLRAKLTPSEYADLKRYAKELTTPAPIKTDFDVWYKLRNAAVNPATRDAFAQEDLNRYKGYLSDADFKELVGVQEGLRNREETTEAKLGRIQANGQVIERSLRQIGLGIDPAKKKQDDPNIAIVYRSVQAAIDREEAETKKPPSLADVQRITDEILTEHIVGVQRSFLGVPLGQTTVKKRTFELGPNDQIVIQARDIPRQYRPALEANIRRTGRAVTDANLVAEYNAQMHGVIQRGPE